MRITSYFLTKLTARTRVLLEKLIFTQLVNEFPDCHGTRKFITMFLRARQSTLSWFKWIQYTSLHYLV